MIEPWHMLVVEAAVTLSNPEVWTAVTTPMGDTMPHTASAATQDSNKKPRQSHSQP